MLSDDGRGLNLRRLIAKLCEDSRLLDVSAVTLQQVADSVFLSGMSTAEQLTDISGRGVGMDAVKKYLNAVGCDIRIVLPPDASLESEFAPFVLIVDLNDKIFHRTQVASRVDAAA